MKRLVSVLSALLVTGLSFFSSAQNAPKKDYSVEAVPLSNVDITDEFWAPKQEVNRTVSIQHCILKSEERGGMTIGGGILEGAGYMIAKRHDPAFEGYIKKRVDATVERSVAASANANQAMRGGGPSPEAAVAYYEATNDRRLLDLSIKAADAADAVYGPGKKGYISGHEGQKIGLIRLFRFNGDEKYWQLAKFLLDIRGRDEYQQQSASEYPGEREYNQNHKPVLEQSRGGRPLCAGDVSLYPADRYRGADGATGIREGRRCALARCGLQKMYLTGRDRLHPAAGKIRCSL